MCIEKKAISMTFNLTSGRLSIALSIFLLDIIRQVLEDRFVRLPRGAVNLSMFSRIALTDLA